MSVMFFPKALKSACVVATRAHANAKNEYYAIFPSHCLIITKHL